MRELLLCPPDYYGIEYEINPWMSRARGAETDLVKSQWQGLHQTLVSLEGKVELVPPQPKLPDMVFTANAGLNRRRSVLSRAISDTKSAPVEAPFFAEWMKEQGFEVVCVQKPVFRRRRRRALRRRPPHLRLQIRSKHRFALSNPRPISGVPGTFGGAD